MHGNMVFSRESIFHTPQQSGCLCVCIVDVCNVSRSSTLFCYMGHYYDYRSVPSGNDVIFQNRKCRVKYYSSKISMSLFVMLIYRHIYNMLYIFGITHI